MGDMSVGPLPTLQTNIRQDLLERGLSASFPGIKLDGFRIEDAHHGFSTILRVHLTPAADNKANLPASVILKGGFEEFSRARGADFTYRSLEMEYWAYQMLPELGLNMPEIFCSHLDPENQQMIILMEDLTLNDVRFQRGVSPNNAGQVARRLTALADLHSRTWGSKELEPGGKYARLERNGAQMFLDYLDHGGFTDQEYYTNFHPLPRIQACPAKLQDYDWLKRYMAYCAEMSDALPNCVIHGDTHLGNLYEEADGTPGFFDSLARQEPGISEATYHICNALDPMERRKHERDLVAHYRAELIKRGVPMPSLWEVMHQYTTFLSLNLITFFVNPTHYQTEAFNTAHAVRAAMAIVDNHGYDLV